MQYLTLFLTVIPLVASAWPHRHHPVPSSTTSSAVATTTCAAPISTPTAPFTVISARSGSPVHLLEWNAAGHAFYLGGATAAYCPTGVVPTCPPDNLTVFASTDAMDTEVPGGQLVYVAPSGALAFEQAHSASFPPGSVLGPFTYTKAPCSQFGDYSTTAFGATGFMECPSPGAAGPYQVFATIQNAIVPSGKVADCLGFDALTTDYTGPYPAAWEYT